MFVLTAKISVKGLCALSRLCCNPQGEQRDEMLAGEGRWDHTLVWVNDGEDSSHPVRAVGAKADSRIFIRDDSFNGGWLGYQPIDVRTVTWRSHSGALMVANCSNDGDWKLTVQCVEFSTYVMYFLEVCDLGSVQVLTQDGLAKAVNTYMDGGWSADHPLWQRSEGIAAALSIEITAAPAQEMGSEPVVEIIRDGVVRDTFSLS